MGVVYLPRPVKPLLGLIGPGREMFEAACRRLSRQWGEVDLESPLYPFDWTDYYTPEMGPGLQRKFVSFAELMEPQQLVARKHLSNEVELEFADEQGGRRINLDPGYLDESKLILASTKDFSFRIYLNRGIFAEVTLQYRRKEGWRELPWTYPDYRAPASKEFFLQVRRRYRRQLAQTPGAEKSKGVPPLR